MIDTSSWYFLRSPCGISSNSWKSIPVYHHNQVKNLNISVLLYSEKMKKEKGCRAGIFSSYQLSWQPETEVVQPDVEPGLPRVAM